ncbi:MAG TPA: SRPBCC family protein [Stellaceae bacterium]|nr:SRPBCC family protein [Stellaceae bacterium]
MLHQDQVEQARKLLAHLEGRSTALADGIYRNPVSDYTCPQQAAREREVFFRLSPICIGLSCLLPQPRDFLTHDYTGVPILLIRQAEGRLRAFLNVCRHRGARLANGRGSDARDFSCPYHGWCYGLDGALLSRPDEGSFAEIDKAARALRELPLVEKYGVIWVSPTPDARFDIDTRLSGLECDLEAYRLASYHHYETRVLQRRINWKVAVDTFLELYHLNVLHPRTVGPILYTNLATFDAFGRNLRMIGARRSIGELRQTPERDWDLIRHSAVVYVLFPNTVFIMQGDHVESWHMFPAGNGVDETLMYASLYTPEPALTDSARRHWDRNMDLLMATVEKEDFPLSEGMQRGFYSGAQQEVIFGRNEPSLQHFHKSVTAALAAAGSATGG